jgi:HSP20 family protein
MAEVKEMTKPKTDGPQAPAKPGPSLAERAERRADRLARRVSSLALKAGSPFAFIRRFAEEMDRLIEDFGIGPGPRLPHRFGRGPELWRPEAELAEAAWTPQVDVRERDGKLVIRADLPGLSKEDIKVDVTEDMITIRGERKQEKTEEREGHSYTECSYGSFYRAVPLPEGVDASQAKAEFRNGVLEVAMPAPSHPQPRARRLEIQEKK